MSVATKLPAAATPRVQDTLASANDLLASHSALISRLRADQHNRLRDLRSIPWDQISSTAAGSSTSKAENDGVTSRSPSNSPTLSLNVLREPHDLFNYPLIPSPSLSPTQSPSSSPSSSPCQGISQLPPKPKAYRSDLPPAKRARVARYTNYVPEEETIRNDYSQRYVDGGEWPQNWVLGADPDKRFEEYPKQQKLLAMKKAAVSQHALPPQYLPYSELSSLLTSPKPAPHPSSTASSTSPSPNNTPLTPAHTPHMPTNTLPPPSASLPPPPIAASSSISTNSSTATLAHTTHHTAAKFDIILIDPPFSSSFTWDDLQELPVPQLAADPSFVFLWVGSGAGEGLERGREVLAKWGFRRCEDIVWVKTNANSNKGPGTDPPTTSLLTRTKQHCLMGIRGTVRRSTDNWFVHCNIDTDVMIWEGDTTDPTLKPPEMYTLIENFCLGLRRLELFGRARTLRRGWLSVLAEGEEDRVDEDAMIIDSSSGEAVTPMKWNREPWEAQVRQLSQGGKPVVPQSSDIEALRPKSPVRGGSSNTNQLPPPPLPHGLPHNPLMGMQNNPMGNMSTGALSGNVPLGNPRSGGGRMSGMGVNPGGMGPPPVPVQGTGGANMMNMGGMDPNLMWTPDMMPMQNGMGGMGMNNMGNMGMNNLGGMGNMGGMGGMGNMQGMGMMGVNQMSQQAGGMWNASGNHMTDNMMGMGGMGINGMGGMGGMGGMNMGMNGMGGMSGMGNMGNMGGMAGMNSNLGLAMGGMNVNHNMGPRMGMNMGMGRGQWS